MSEEFLFELYAQENSDIDAAFGLDERRLLKHYRDQGPSEVRGCDPSHFLNIEDFKISEKGDVLISGWVDRRVHRNLSIAIEIGYIRYRFEEASIAWYHREDVSEVTGDSEKPSGFFALMHIQDLVQHPKVRLFVNNVLCRQSVCERFFSANRFLDYALARTAAFADRPIGETLANGKCLAPTFQRMWLNVVNDMKFTLAFETNARKQIEVSIIIVLYRKADLLMVQLRTLANFLSSEAVEVVIVCNDFLEPGPVIQNLKAFCYLHEADVSFHLCSGNSGFSHANNYGASVARGEKLIFMNPDIFPWENNEAVSFQFLISDPGDALHGTLLYYGDGSLMHSGMYTTCDIAADVQKGHSDQVLRVEHYGKGLTTNINEPVVSIDSVLAPISDTPALASAALWKIKKSVFEKAGGLPLDYIYAYYEDADFCLQFVQNGHEIVIDKTSRWYHMEGVGKASPPQVRGFMWLNRCIYSAKFADSDLVVGSSVDLSEL